MCGRYYISEETYQDLQRIVSLVEQNIKKKIQTGDIHPTETAPVLVWKEPGRLCLTEKTWGYPGWQKKGIIFNARAESVKEKRIFQNGISYHRAVIPVSGFYEWNHQKEKILFTGKMGIPCIWQDFMTGLVWKTVLSFLRHRPMIP